MSDDPRAADRDRPATGEGDALTVVTLLRRAGLRPPVRLLRKAGLDPRNQMQLDAEETP